METKNCEFLQCTKCEAKYTRSYILLDHFRGKHEIGLRLDEVKKFITLSLSILADKEGKTKKFNSFKLKTQVKVVL